MFFFKNQYTLFIIANVTEKIKRRFCRTQRSREKNTTRATRESCSLMLIVNSEEHLRRNHKANPLAAFLRQNSHNANLRHYRSDPLHGRFILSMRFVPVPMIKNEHHKSDTCFCERLPKQSRNGAKKSKSSILLPLDPPPVHLYS